VTKNFVIEITAIEVDVILAIKAILIVPVYTNATEFVRVGKGTWC